MKQSKEINSEIINTNKNSKYNRSTWMKLSKINVNKRRYRMNTIAVIE